MRRGTALLTAALCLCAAALLPAGAQAAAKPAWTVALTPLPANFAPGVKSEYLVLATNVGAAPTSGPESVLEITMPPSGVSILGAEVSNSTPGAGGSSCTTLAQTVTCKTASAVGSGRYLVAKVLLEADGSTATIQSTAKISGGEGGEAEATSLAPVQVEPVAFEFLPGFASPVTEEDGSPDTLAGSHPYQQSTSFAFPVAHLGEKVTNAGHPRDISVELPRGLVGSPAASKVLCTEVQLVVEKCPDESQVGVIDVTTLVAEAGHIGVSSTALYNMVPPPGSPAELATNVAGAGLFAHVQVNVRSDGDYGVEAVTHDVLAYGQQPIFSVQAQVWGDPSSAAHERIRGKCIFLNTTCPVPARKPALLTMPSDCPGSPLPFEARADSWEEPNPPATEREAHYESADLAGNPVSVKGCGSLPFEPTIQARPTTNVSDSPSGLDFDLHQAQEEVEGRSPAALRDAAITFPPGMVVNPSQANGLGACSETQIGFLKEEAGQLRFSKEPQSCPDAAKLGTVEVTSPALVARNEKHEVETDIEENVKAPTPALSVFKAGTGSGSVTSSPAGIACGETCAAEFETGEVVTLTPAAATGSEFTGWSGACSGTGACQVTMGEARSVTASFALEEGTPPPSQFQLTVFTIGTGSGSVTSSPAGIACGETCAAEFEAGEVVTLTPAAAPGSEFTGWSGACSGTGACQVTMSETGSVGAGFEKDIEENPVLEVLHGSIYIAKPFANPLHSLVATYLAVEDQRLGIVAKLAGEARLDPSTGQVTAVFTENPELPFEDVSVHLFGGARGAFITPPACGHFSTTSDLTPWSAPEGKDRFPDSSFATSVAPGGGACPGAEAQLSNAPKLVAGTTPPSAGKYAPLIFKLSREDGTQRLGKIEAALPAGLSAKLAGVGICSEAQIAKARSREVPEEGALEGSDPSCPAASQIGIVNAAAGAGPTPYYTQGHAYLAGPYKGAPLSIVAIAPAVAGPFDLGAVVVRSALYIDPETARARVVSDPLPRILQGVPIDLRSVAVRAERPDFSLNPTSCAPESFAGQALSTLGQPASLFEPFQVGGCSSLPYKPKLTTKLFGPIHRGGHPRLRSVFVARAGDANTARISFALPHSEFIDQAHFRTICTRVQFAANQCPAGAVYGHITATSPLVDYALEGPIYLRSSSHKLPDVVAVLKGPPYQPIEVDLDGRVDSVNGGIRTTFETVPDQPVSRAVVTLQGGRKGLFQNSTDICKGAHRATLKLLAQNGKVADSRPKILAQCGKAKKKKGGAHKRH
jgi:Divergent InlB B-repeat domain